MGGLMSQKGYEPYVILSSPAVRAQTTAEIVKKAGKLDGELRSEHRIYEASPPTLKQTVAELDDAYPTALVVGHNPGIEGFINYLTGQLEPMPTAALAVINLDIDNWISIKDGCGKLDKVYRPKQEMR